MKEKKIDPLSHINIADFTCAGGKCEKEMKDEKGEMKEMRIDPLKLGKTSKRKKRFNSSIA